jgi:glycosyltransferase involved in cell wall biosynthesis
MKVVFDAERLRNPNSGLGQFCSALGHFLLAVRPPDAEMTFIVPPGYESRFADASSLRTRWWMRFVTPSFADVWHATHQDVWIRPPAAARLVLSIMDLNFLERADYSDAKKARRLAAVQRRVDAADAIAPISEFSASVVRQHLNVRDIPIRVIHLGNPLEYVVGGPYEPVPGSLAGLQPGSYFLFVGVIHPKKNVRTLVPILRAFPSMSLVLAGPDEHSYAGEVRDAARDAGVADRVIIPGRVSDETKRWLYAGSRALLFPSLSEGFGLPVVEAMSLGKPAFLSRLTSLPEIGGDAAYYFDSFDPESMIATIRRGLADYDSHPQRPDELRAHASRYSWTRAATEYWSLYDEVLRSPRR